MFNIIYKIWEHDGLLCAIPYIMDGYPNQQEGDMNNANIGTRAEHVILDQ